MSKPRLLRLAPGKVGFFDDVTRIHLTITSPQRELIAEMPVSPAIRNGILGESLIDVNKNIINAEGNPIPVAEQNEKETKKEEPSKEEEEDNTDEEDDTEDDKSTKKTNTRSRRTNNRSKASNTKKKDEEQE